MTDLQRVAFEQRRNAEIPNGYLSIYSVLNAYVQHTMSWKGHARLEGSANWFFTPSYFVDQEFFSENGETIQQKSRSNKLRHSRPEIQRYIVDEDQRARSGIYNLLFRRFLHKNLEELRTQPERPEQPPGNVERSKLESIRIDQDELSTLTAAGPATLTQSMARNDLSELRQVDDELLNHEGMPLLIRKKYVPSEDRVHAEIDQMSGLLCSANSERMKALAEECGRFVKLVPGPAPRKESIAEHFGVSSTSNKFKNFWSAFCTPEMRPSVLSEEEHLALSRKGRRSKKNILAISQKVESIFWPSEP